MAYQSRHTGTLADLLLRQGDIAADKAARSGQMWGNVARGVASIPAGIQQRKAAEAEKVEAAEDRRLTRANTASLIADRESARDERDNRRMDEQGTKDLALTTQKVSAWLGDIASAPDPESMKMAYKVGRDALVGEGRLTPQDAPEFFPGASWVKSRMAQLLPAAERFKQMFPEPKAPIQADPTKDLLDPTTFGVIRPGTPEPKAPTNPTEASLAAAAAAGDPNALKALELIRGQQREPMGPQAPVAVIGPDGQPVLVRPQDAFGRRPASNREQGRPVTSGDAGKLAELDTSLNDLATLGATLSETENATGTAAKIGASMWNPITELTGWGEDAKKRQGVIDRVKQVIGKALEGGVLRKEDEYKYTKILPTIGDTQAVAASKLKGLKDALVLRRQTMLDALADAGYDVARFQQRTQGGGTPDPVGIR